MDFPAGLFTSASQHFRTATLSRRPPEWPIQLPAVRCADDEIRALPEAQLSRDEQATLARLAEPRAVSAEITTWFQLSRDMVDEALQTLRYGKGAQRNLLALLSATRYKAMTKEVLRATYWPLQASGDRDSFSHMLRCYDLEQHLGRSAAAVSPLVRMARKTQILDPTLPKPFRRAG